MATYIGPYLRCIAHNIPTETELITCPNFLCPNHHKKYLTGKFCNDCAFLLVPQKVPAHKCKISTNYVYKAIDGVLTEAILDHTDKPVQNAQTHIWVPNRDSEGCCITNDLDKYTMIEVPGGHRENTWSKFSERYEDAIEKFRELYGDENVTQEWGVINY